MESPSRADITKILEAASTAPSGDNTQPWRFVARGSLIEFHYLPEKDHPVLNYEEGGTLIALGAAVQNAEFAAKTLGYDPTIEFLETGSCVARMTLERKSIELSEREKTLAAAVSARHTNRKPYAKKALGIDVRKELAAEAVVTPGDVDLELIESREDMKKLSRALTTMEEIALGNEVLHKAFFDDIFWDEARNEAGEHGLYIKTLELPPPARGLFTLLKHWWFARALSYIGFPRLVARMNASQNASAAAFGVIIGSHTSRHTYLEVGRLLERVWLTATAHALSLQIVTGITFLARAAQSENPPKIFNAHEHERIAQAYATIQKIVGDERVPILVFRIGEGGTPSDVSRRKAPEILFD